MSEATPKTFWLWRDEGTSDERNQFIDVKTCSVVDVFD